MLGPQSRRCLLSSSPRTASRARAWSPATGAVSAAGGPVAPPLGARFRVRSAGQLLVRRSLFSSTIPHSRSPSGGISAWGAACAAPSRSAPRGASSDSPSGAAVGVQTPQASPRLRPQAAQTPASLQTKPKAADQGVGHSLLDSSWTSRWLHSCGWTTRRGHRPAGLQLRAPPWTLRLRPQTPCRDVASRWPEPRTASQCSATILFHLHGKCCRRWSVSRAAPGIVPCLSPHGDELE